VTRAAHGGSCYLNNTAVAAAALVDVMGCVAVLDIDAHHGNGTQEIFYDRDDVVVGSVHVDPAGGWFPHFVGSADETGGGANRNVPLAPGSADDVWTAAVRDLVAWAEEHRPRALVVALGVDAAEGDPESPLRVTQDGFREAGRELAGLDVHTVFVQEGGYDVTTIGALVRTVLEGFEA
jgi:acetoin utilization deacetylase AcuC-like enzyme